MYRGGVTTRQTGRGAVRRLLFAASLALLALVPAWAAPPAAAAADRLPNLLAAPPVRLPHRQRQRPPAAAVHEHPHQRRGRDRSRCSAAARARRRRGRVQQVIDNDAGGERRVDTDATLRYAGDGHDHWHVEQMMAYHLWSSQGTRADRKVGFCFFDTTLWAPEPAALAEQPATTASRGAADATALTSRTGISVGWADTYRWQPRRTSGSTSPGCRAGRTRSAPCPTRTTGSSRRTRRTAAAGRRCSSARAARRSRSSARGAAASTTGRARTFETAHRVGVSTNGITGGCDLDMFCTGNAVTRVQMAMFIDRAMRPAADRPGLLHRRRRPHRRGEHQSPGRGRHHRRLRRAAATARS